MNHLGWAAGFKEAASTSARSSSKGIVTGCQAVCGRWFRRSGGLSSGSQFPPVGERQQTTRLNSPESWRRRTKRASRGSWASTLVERRGSALAEAKACLLSNLAPMVPEVRGADMLVGSRRGDIRSPVSSKRTTCPLAGSVQYARVPDPPKLQLVSSSNRVRGWCLQVLRLACGFEDFKIPRYYSGSPTTWRPLTAEQIVMSRAPTKNKLIFSGLIGIPAAPCVP